MQTMMLQPSRAPVGDAPPPAAEGQPTEAPPQGPPADGGGLFGGMGVILLPLVLMVGLMLFMSRSDRKRREKLEASLKKGDRVLTQAGFIGKLIDVGPTEVRVEIAPGVVVKMVKSAVQGHAEVNTPAPAKDAKAEKEPKAAEKKK